METHYHSHGAGYLLVLACTYCGKKAQITRFSDPQRHYFRRWSKEEAAELLTTHQKVGHAGCPVCGAAVQCRHVSEGALWMVECPRCGNIQQTCGEARELVESHAVSA